jgi:endonuclease V-like protein UPF0215 family
MPTDNPPADHPPADPDHKISPADALPDVKPPSAGFIIQLFVIPGVIVLVIVMVWLMFTWLAHVGGSDPRASLDAMRQDRPNSWQQAWNLVESLQKDEKYKKDATLAKEIADFLRELRGKELPPGSSSPNTPNEPRRNRDVRSEEINRQLFLCKALGEFLVADDSLPVLIEVAGSHRGDDELDVRLAALESIALLAHNLHDVKPLDDPALMPMLLAASRDPDHRIAIRAVMALSSLGTAAAIERLEEIVSEGHHVDVHYNAATGLARYGNTACVEMLLEMLDPTETRGVDAEGTERTQAEEQSADLEQRKAYKRTMILLNGLRAAGKLAQTNPQADVAALRGAVERLLKADVNPQVRDQAKNTLRSLQR